MIKLLCDWLLSAIVLLITVNLGFYASYKDASGFEDLSDNGLWKYIFQKMAGVGFAIYCVVAFISNLVASLLNRRVLAVDTFKTRLAKWARFTIDLMLSYAALKLILSVYDFVLSGLFMDEGFADIAKGAMEHTSYRLLMSVQAIANIFSHFSEVSTVADFVVAVSAVLVKCLLFVAFHVFFFSVLYGFLDHKIEVFDLSGKWSKWREEDSESLNFGTRMRQWWLEVTEVTPVYAPCALENNWDMMIPGALLMSALGLDGFVSNTFSDLVMTAIDAIDLVNVVVSFVISWVAAKFIWRAGQKVVEHLPEEVQIKLANLSQTLKQKAEDIKLRRDKFAFRVDAIHKATRVAKEKMKAWSTAEEREHPEILENQQKAAPEPFTLKEVVKPERPKPIVDAGIPTPPLSARDNECQEFYLGLREFLESNGIATTGVEDRDLGSLYIDMGKERAEEREAYRKAAREYNTFCRKYNDYQQKHNTGAPLRELVPEDIEVITWDKGWYI